MSENASPESDDAVAAVAPVESLAISPAQSDAPAVDEPALGRRLVDAHLGSAFAGLTLIFVVLKVLAVSHGGTTTALGIVAEGETAPLLMGTLVEALGPVLYAMISVVMWMQARPDSWGATPLALRGAGILAVLICALVTPVLVLPIHVFFVWGLMGMPGAIRAFGGVLQSRLNRQWRPFREAQDQLAATHGDQIGLLTELQIIAERFEQLRPLDPSPELVAQLNEIETALPDMQRRWGELVEREGRIVAKNEDFLQEMNARTARLRRWTRRIGSWVRTHRRIRRCVRSPLRPPMAAGGAPDGEWAAPFYRLRPSRESG